MPLNHSRLRAVLRSLAGAALLALVAPLQSQAPDAHIEMMGDAPWFERQVAEGVVWKSYFFEGLFDSYQNINVVEIDMDHPEVRLDIAYRVPPPEPAYQLLHEMVREQLPDAVAAINGSYFKIRTTGESDTYLRIGGDTVVDEQRPPENLGMHGTFAIKNDGRTADVLTMRPDSGWGDTEALDWENMLASGPNLAADGEMVLFEGTAAHCTARHPRSAIGVTADNRVLMVTVDGRQEFAQGMTCDELAMVMHALGSHNALNLDGGGSTTLWVGTEPGHAGTGVVNRFSDARIRAVSDGIAVTAPPVENASPFDARLMGVKTPNHARAGDVMEIVALYQNIGTEELSAAEIALVPSRPFGRESAMVNDEAELTVEPAAIPPGETMRVVLRLAAPEVEADTVVTEYFALSHAEHGFFGPGDHEVGFTATIRPPVGDTPPPMIIQGTTTGPNSIWYRETAGRWANSAVGFTAPGVTNRGTQRYMHTNDGVPRSAQFLPEFDVEGVYRVEAAFPSSRHNITNVRYIVEALDGTHTMVIDQSDDSGAEPNSWIALGEFPFGVTGHSITVSNPEAPESGDRFYSGAIRIEYVGPIED